MELMLGERTIALPWRLRRVLVVFALLVVFFVGFEAMSAIRATQDQVGNVPVASKRAVEATIIGADTLRQLVGSPWLETNYQWRVAIGDTHRVLNLPKSNTPMRMPSSRIDKMVSEQSGLIHKFFAGQLRQSELYKLKGLASAYSTHDVLPWVSQVYRVKFDTIDVQGNRAGVRASVFLWYGGAGGRSATTIRTFRFRVQVLEYVTLLLIHGTWHEVTYRSYLLPVQKKV